MWPGAIPTFGSWISPETVTPDVLITEDEAFMLYPSPVEEEFGSGIRVPQPADGERGPRLVFADSTQSVYLADIYGSGTTDILYLAPNRIAIIRNQSGNRFNDPEYLTNFPPIDNLAAVQALDLLGNNTACLVWSSPLSKDAARPMRYLDLMGGQKPHLLTRTRNNLGAEAIIQYAPFTKFYSQDKFAEGRISVSCRVV
jgi:hypothetical protein